MISLQRPLISFDKWSRVSSDNSTLAVTAAGFGARQQAIVRRLVGAEVYEREVVPKLTIQRYNKVRVMEAVGLTALHEYSVSEDSVSSTIGWSRGSVDVYPQLTPAFFDSLAQYLPEPCRRFIVDDAAFRKHLDPVTRAAAPSEPHCQWLLGCWDAVLLPKCAQWVERMWCPSSSRCASPRCRSGSASSSRL